MALDLNHKRKNYTKATLDDTMKDEDPIQIFTDWYKMAEQVEASEENAMTLSTVDQDNRPHARIVLLKYFSKEGFEFYTNYKSNKGKHISANAYVCLSFFWEALEKQVLIGGKVIKLSEDTSDEYFNVRPKESQIAAIASEQSQPIASREVLIKKWEKLNKQSEGLKRPENWGGYRVVPNYIEFWQGGEYRLHDRIRFTKNQDKKWQGERLSP